MWLWRPRCRWRELSLSLLSSGGVAHAADELDEGVVVFQQTTWWREGQPVDTATTGSLDVTLDDGRPWRVDTEHQDAPDGSVFSVEWEMGQDAEDAPEFSRIRVVRYRPTVVPVEERLQELEVTYGGLSDLKREEWRERLEHPVSGHEPFRSDALLAWLREAADDDRTRVTVSFLERAPSRVASPLAIARDAPTVALDLLEQRVLDHEEQKTWIDAFQAPWIAEAEAGGATGIRSARPYNGLTFEAPAALVRRWAADPRVDTLEFPGLAVDTSSNDGEETRLAMQVAQFPNNDYDGDRATGANTHNAVFVAIVDHCLDIDHPAWLDGGGGTSRLVKHWSPNSQGVWVETQTGCASATKQHGTMVTGVAVGDLMDGQVPSMDVDLRKARSGFSWESTFEFFNYERPNTWDYRAVWAKVRDRRPDIVNRSQLCNSGPGEPCSYCQNAGSVTDEVDDMFLDGIFVVLPSGNFRSGTTCRVQPPATAAGSFTVGGYDVTDVADLQAGPLWNNPVGDGSAAGNDSWGRAIIDLAGPAGRENDFTGWNDGYLGMAEGNSFSAPAIAGAAANLVDNIVNRHGGTIASEPGYLHALLLSMGDGKLRSGNLAPDSPPDPDWGMGRARMRLISDAGMDSPWRVRLCNPVVTHGTNFTNCAVNPNDNGVNQALPEDVDQLRITSFWFEPNLGGNEVPATINLLARKNGNLQAETAPETPIGAQRLWFSSGVGGNTWQSEGEAIGVPASTNSRYHHQQTKRKLYTVVLWEDLDRDEDLDGPGDEIQ
jgi:hypothetical protein